MLNLIKSYDKNKREIENTQLALRKKSFHWLYKFLHKLCCERWTSRSTCLTVCQSFVKFNAWKRILFGNSFKSYIFSCWRIFLDETFYQKSHFWSENICRRRQVLLKSLSECLQKQSRTKRTGNTRIDVFGF